MPSKKATAPKSLKAVEKAVQPSMRSRLLSFGNIRAGLVAVSATGLTGYWFRQTILDAVLAVRDGIIGTLGLGVVPVVAWLGLFGWTLAKRRSWLRPRWLRLWLASLALVALTLGVLSFFYPIRGSLAPFSLYGEVSLGGRMGESITGPSAWLAVLKLMGLFMAGTAAASPKLALKTSMALGKLAVSAYVFSVLAASTIVRMYRIEKRPGPEEESLSTAVALRDSTVPAVSPSTGAGQMSITPLYSLDDEEASEGAAPRARGPVIVYPDGHTKVIDFAEDIDLQEDNDAPVFGDGRLIQHQSSGGTTTQLDEEDSFEDSDEGQLAEDEDALAAEDSLDATEEGEPGGEEEHIQGQPSVLHWQKPPLDIMQNGSEEGITEEEMIETAETIKRTLAEYGVEVEIGQIRPGPTVTMYGLIPGWVRRHKQVKELDANGRPRLDMFGKPVITQVEQKTRVKVDAILAREKDLALALKTPSIRIETPVMGKSQVGIEVPNPKPSVVTLRSVMESEEFRRLVAKAHLPVALGKGSGGETAVIDLAKMPHLLIAGATGSGKSVCLNTIVSCLILEKTPAELRLLLIDPKRVELTPYNGIPHLLCPVVVDTDKVVGLLKGVIREMLDRYRRMEVIGVRNIEAYNKKSNEKMPFLVVVVDELADLMMTAAFDVEQSLCRLAQLGRATGIHLIVATQRPSVDVVTGLIKANFPSRISFAVTSQVDSRTILDSGGADKLMGKGDMLYLPIDGSRPSRVQGVYISDREIEGLVHFWQTIPWAPAPRIHLRAEPEGDEDSDDDDLAQGSSDELISKAIQLAQTHNKLSTSLLQRRLRIGYPRAARLMDELEEKGVVGPGDGSKSRDVIMNRA